MVNDFMCYLKTTDTCQLNCRHCFTNGSNGKKGFFDVEKTIDFFHRLHDYNPNYDYGNISFHGGEPMLAPVPMMREVWDGCKDLWSNLWWSVQTNLTYPLTDEKREFFKDVCTSGFGTSWDKNIRWPEQEQISLWERNVRTITGEDKHDLTVMVCITADVVKMEPIEIIDYIAGLGVKHINFERLTPNGNALMFPTMFARNADMDKWFLKMWEQTVKHKAYEYIDNMFFDSVLTSFVYNTHAGCRCRQCEQKILTINADGRIGGCPNSAVENTFGTIDDDIHTLLNSEGRMCNIQAEAIRPPGCWTCDVFDICNGDCHQLAWEGPVCPAPKSLMQELKHNQDVPLFKDVLDGFRGQE